MESLERCRIIIGLSTDNEAKLALLQVLLDKARLDIEAFCRDNFIDKAGKDVFPNQLKNIMEDLAIQRFRKRGAEGNECYTLADESITFEDKLPETVQRQLYTYRRVFPRNNIALIETEPEKEPDVDIEVDTGTGAEPEKEEVADDNIPL